MKRVAQWLLLRLRIRFATPMQKAWGGSLKRLWRLRGHLQLAMTEQTEPEVRRLGQGTRACARMTLLALLGGLGMSALARAEAHPVHARPRVAVRPTLVAQNDQARNRKSGASKNADSHSKTKAAAGRAAKSRAAHPAAPAAAKGKPRRKHAPVVEEPDPIVTRRTKLKHGPSAARPMLKRVAIPQPEASAPMLRREAATVKRTNVGAPLTVDDFVRAAAPPDDPQAAAKAYVPGESHTEADERAATQKVAVQAPPLQPLPVLKPGVRKPVVNASVEAAEPIEEVPGGLAEPLPADLVGAPVMPAATQGAGPKAPHAASALPRPPAPTRQELTAEALQPVVLPGLYRNGRLVVPAPLKGTHDILVHQNTMADDEGLERIQDEDDLQRLRAAHLLVNFPESASLHVNPELGADRRCARVWTVRFAADIARGFYARFHQPLQVNSAVRTVAYQVRLQRVNGNAAGTDGETASPHLTGQALDLGKRGMSMAEIAWMRAYLLPLMQSGKVDVEEEFQQACFHISVYRAYMPLPAKHRAPRNEVAQLREPRLRAAEKVIADK